MDHKHDRFRRHPLRVGRSCLFAAAAVLSAFLSVNPSGLDTIAAQEPATLDQPKPDHLTTEIAESLWAAARKGELSRVFEAIEAGADVNAKTNYGATALSFAADRGHVEVVQYLLSQKAEPNSKDTSITRHRWPGRSPVNALRLSRPW